MPVSEASARLLALVSPLVCETIDLRDGAGRHLAQAVTARRDQPPFDSSAMDGYALAGEHGPWSVIGEAAAGHAHGKALAPGEAARIFTGAPVPAGADRVALQENMSRDGAMVHGAAPAPGANIRPRGQDFRDGARLTPRRLRPSDLALIASMNVARIDVARRPRVAILATGDELVMPGEAPRADQIIASNGFALKAIAEEEGAIARLLPIAPDHEAGLRETFALARDADLIVTIGGASVGDHDLIMPVAQSLGLEAAFWKIALRPGKPLIAGRMTRPLPGQPGGAQGPLLLGLPGNPVSTVVCAELFLRPVLRALQGDPRPLPRPRRARLGADLPANGPRDHYMRAHWDELSGLITPAPRQDSSLLSVLSEANALLIHPANAAPMAAGDMVEWLALQATAA